MNIDTFKYKAWEKLLHFSPEDTEYSKTCGVSKSLKVSMQEAEELSANQIRGCIGIPTFFTSLEKYT